MYNVAFIDPLLEGKLKSQKRALPDEMLHSSSPDIKNSFDRGGLSVNIDSSVAPPIPSEAPRWRQARIKVILSTRSYTYEGRYYGSCSYF